LLDRRDKIGNKVMDETKTKRISLERHVRECLMMIAPEVLLATSPNYVRGLTRRLREKEALSDTDILARVEEDRAATEAYWDLWDKSADNVRTERGISEEIWEGRPYMRWPDPLTRDEWEYEIPDVSALSGAYFGLEGAQRRYMERLARQSPGWVIMRHPVPGRDHVYAEIRPDIKVETGPPVRHWHGTGDAPEETNEPGVSILDYGSYAWAEHVRKVNKDDSEPDTDHAAREDVHEHIDAAKYVFPPSGRREEPWVHEHYRGRSGAWYKKHPEALERHYDNWHHKNPETVEWLVEGFGTYRIHKHTRRVKDSDNNYAKRLDIHPMALERLEAAETVFFGIEGCLKADAILSAIIREGWNASVFSVPSVSLWEADELKEFAQTYLQSKLVIIVPDADWVDNRAVITQARKAEFFLRRRCGVRTYVAAAPLIWENGKRKVEYKGVDDYLGAGRKLGDLTVMERTESLMLNKVKERQIDKGYRKDRVENDAESLRALAHQATIQPDGRGLVQTTLVSLAGIIGTCSKTAKNTIKRAQGYGWLELVGSFATQKGYHVKGEGWYPGPEEWRKSKIDGEKKENPRIYIHAELCGEDKERTLDRLLEDLALAKSKVTYGGFISA
jgi:hypothetical protein